MKSDKVLEAEKTFSKFNKVDVGGNKDFESGKKGSVRLSSASPFECFSESLSKKAGPLGESFVQSSCGLAKNEVTFSKNTFAPTQNSVDDGVQSFESGSERGFVYQGRALYSKVDPKKVSRAALCALQVLPDTLFVVSSPVLCFGLGELIAKFCAEDKNSAIVALECEEPLAQVALKKSKSFDKTRFFLLDEHSAKGFIDSLASEGGEFYCRFKRVETFPGAASAALHKDFYGRFFLTAQNIVFSQIKNTLTLIKFGKRYCVNFFRNLARYSKEKSLSALDKKVEKPILVVAAGLSAEKLYTLSEEQKAKYFIICVDAMAPFLVAAGFKNFLVVSDEAQAVIRNCFLALRGFGVTVAHSLSAAPVDFKLLGVKELFYTTEFFPAHFIKRLAFGKDFPPTIPPLGSVGLTAVEIALRVRKSAQVPIFTLGLDFSYKPMKTHARDSFPIIRRLETQNRLSAPLSPTGKTTSNMAGYKALFDALFSKVVKELV